VALTAAVAASDDRLGSPADWRLHVLIRNDGSEAVSLSTSTMIGSVAFELRDEHGRQLPLGPPPMPPSDLTRGLVVLPPDGALPLEFRGDELLPETPPEGRYRLRFAGSAPPLEGAWSGRIESPWVEFVVGAR
jgi:hypothetical protein